MDTRKLSILGALVAGLVCLSAPPALALGPGFDVTASKHKGGPYTSDSQDATIQQGKSKTFWWQVENTGITDLELRFDDAATGADGYKVKWFKGRKNITEDAQGAGYDFGLKAGKAKLFHAKVKYTGGPEPLCLGGQATDTSIPVSDSAYFSVNGLCT